VNHEQKEQLRRYTEEFDAFVMPLDVDTIVRSDVQVVSSPASTLRRRMPVWAVPVLAGFLIVLIVGGVPWLLFGLSESEVADSVVVPTTIGESGPQPSLAPVPTNPPVTQTPSTATPPPSTEMFPTWTSVAGPEGALDVGGWGVLTTNSEGFVFCADTWYATSINGVDWERIDHARGFSSRGSCMIWDGVAVSTSGGGASGAEGQPMVADPSFIEVSQANGEFSSFRIDGDITAEAIGGKGILVATVDNRLDHEILLGLTPAEEEVGLSTSNVENGVLYATFNDGTARSVDLAEMGIDPEDLDKTSWWYSEDGAEWSPIPVNISFDVWNLIGTADGFYTVGDSKVWYSPDGRSWETVMTVSGDAWLTLIGNRPVLNSDTGFTFLDEDQTVEIPVLEPPGGAIKWVQSETSALAVKFWDAESDDFQPVELWYAEHGHPFQPENLPAEMAAANVFGMWTPMGTAVDNRYLLLLFENDFEPTFWIKDLPVTCLGVACDK
jgi:hypothetical protein